MKGAGPKSPCPRILRLLASIGALFLCPLSAQAEPSAQQLFDQGLAAMLGGHPEKGCPLLRQSQKAEPRIGTLFTLAECEAKAGLIASALRNYQEYLRWTERLEPSQKPRQKRRVQIASEQVRALTPLVPMLTVRLSPQAPSGTIVERNGAVLSPSQLGQPEPLDPGEYVLSAKAPGTSPKEQHLVLQKGDRKEIELAVTLPLVVRQSPAPVPFSPRPEATPASNATRTWAYISLGAGTLGLVTGSVTGLMAMQQKKTIDRECVDTACSHDGKQAADRAQTLGTISTVGFGVGLAGLVTGVVLWRASPKQEAPQAAVRPIIAGQGVQGAMVGFQGAW